MADYELDCDNCGGLVLLTKKTDTEHLAGDDTEKWTELSKAREYVGNAGLNGAMIYCYLCCDQTKGPFITVPTQRERRKHCNHEMDSP